MSAPDSRQALRKKGRERRKQVPRSSHGEWSAPGGRADPVELLQAQDKNRLQHLLPIKYGRMVASPFAFFRGSAAVMAADLAGRPVSGIDTILCGDAHISNFGLFATPERNLVFDLNDFDEAHPGPWEWDVMRLAASAVVAARQLGLKDKKARHAAMLVGRSYREAMQHFSGLPILDTWYFQVKADEIVSEIERKYGREAVRARKSIKKARGRTQAAALEKLTEVVEGRRRFINDPPLLVSRFDELLNEHRKGLLLSRRVIEKAWLDYLDSLPEERRPLLEKFQISDVALRVVGVGSVGTRCGIVLLDGGASEDSIILQLKEAGPSVLEPYLPRQEYVSHAYRVVFCQRLLQSASDLFLGWNQGAVDKKYFYWRQLKDMKGSIDIEALDETGLQLYVQLCSWCLAHAHARAGDPTEIAGYLGTGSSFDVAIRDFADSYADQNERDYQELVDAVKTGRIAVETGI